MILKDLDELIDKAISRDFIIHAVSEEDHQNDSYKALLFTLTFNKIRIQYERKVETTKALKIPKFQYLFGFNPNEGLCVFVNKKEHKRVLCDGPLEEISKTCLLVHSLVYLLVPTNKFQVYSYYPTCCELNCVNHPKQYELRTRLYTR